MDEIDICNRALQMAGSRNKISSLSSDSEEAQNCNLLYSSVRDQVLSMAFWNFARKTVQLNLIKASPGSQMAAPSSLTAWSTAFPAPPWLFEYAYPSDCVQMRYVSPQPGTYAGAGIPIFSTPAYTYDTPFGLPPQKFIVGTDTIYPWTLITGITKANPAVVTSAAHGIANGSTVYLTGILGMTQLNGLTFTTAGATTDTFQLVGIDATSYSTYQQNGVVVNQSGTAAQANVILTNAMQALGTYVMNVDVSLWTSSAIQAFVSALAGFLAVPISGDRNLAQMLIAQANDHIMQARASDGNEGLTTQEIIPDWIRIRQTSAFPFDAGYYTSPYPALFGNV